VGRKTVFDGNLVLIAFRHVAGFPAIEFGAFAYSESGCLELGFEKNYGDSTKA
jgi:hypothetical protein